MGYSASNSRAEATAIPQATAAATYFIFGNDANVKADTSQSLTATPTATAVAAAGGSSAGSTGSGANQALSPGILPASVGGFSTQTLLLVGFATVAAFLIARRFA